MYSTLAARLNQHFTLDAGSYHNVYVYTRQIKVKGKKICMTTEQVHFVHVL